MDFPIVSIHVDTDSIEKELSEKYFGQETCPEILHNFEKDARDLVTKYTTVQIV